MRQPPICQDTIKHCRVHSNNLAPLQVKTQPQPSPEQCLLCVLQLSLLVFDEPLHMARALVQGDCVVHQRTHHALDALAVASLWYHNKHCLKMHH